MISLDLVVLDINFREGIRKQKWFFSLNRRVEWGIQGLTAQCSLLRETKMVDSGDLNLLREKMDETIDAYASIIDLDEFEEVRALGNDLMSVFRDFLKQVEGFIR